MLSVWDCAGRTTSSVDTTSNVVVQLRIERLGTPRTTNQDIRLCSWGSVQLCDRLIYVWLQFQTAEIQKIRLVWLSMWRLKTRIVIRRIPGGARICEMMKVEAEVPGFSLETPIPAASTSDLEETQDGKNLSKWHIGLCRIRHPGGRLL